MNSIKDKKIAHLLSRLASKAEEGFSQIASGISCLAGPGSVEESVEEVKRDAKNLLDRAKVFRRIGLRKN